ncbi:MAG: TetR/AcrR family transcriptional regulator [Nitriliruptoraceae bacterium]
MVREDAETRDRLLDAAEELFARQGSWTTPLAHVVRAAGQRNQSAVQYHFGTREELIYALIERDRDRELQLRQELLDRLDAGGGEADLRLAVAALVLPSCASLGRARGRRLRLIIADVARGISDAQLADPRPPDIARTVRLLEAAMPAMPAGVTATRIAAALRLQIELTAARARELEAGRQPLVSDATFERDLQGLVHAMLAAPPP